MSADILPFGPARRQSDAAPGTPRHDAGDILIACLNDSLPGGKSLWCAWPVAAVDDDGIVMGVQTRAGGTICAARVSCRPEVYGVRAADHDPDGFASLRWRTWFEAGDAIMAFAAIGLINRAESDAPRDGERS